MLNEQSFSSLAMPTHIINWRMFRDDPLRCLIYGMCESFGMAVQSVVEWTQVPTVHQEPQQQEIQQQEETTELFTDCEIKQVCL